MTDRNVDISVKNDNKNSCIYYSLTHGKVSVIFKFVKDDIVLIMHMDRKDHVVMNYAQDFDRLPIREQEALALLVRFYFLYIKLVLFIFMFHGSCSICANSNEESVFWI